ncbi:cysteine dioxygenase [Fluviispira multicolorata]|uniref:Cupin type-1 domain-containing protein n=1 Tax=Fluviispira multicolorata TaxID=2654512 RepID=A0A833JES4_9BACT|nr:cysteine dioxygenase family protein [Fluviispira multicolorata]KAB8032059.1 hypothetical protein GCL57_05270 [Fluviispira multicolorata]
MTPKKITLLVKYLKSLNKSVSWKELEIEIENLSIEIKDILNYLEDPLNLPYGRKLVFKSSLIECLIMTWSIEKACLPHDHGISEGAIYVVNGQGKNSIFNFSNKQSNQRELINTFLNKGDFIYVPKGIIHLMQSLGDDRLVTLHFYSPAIHDMKVFDTKNNRQGIVSDDCGAWWPEVPEKLLREEKIDEKFLNIPNKIL